MKKIKVDQLYYIQKNIDNLIKNNVSIDYNNGRRITFRLINPNLIDVAKLTVNILNTVNSGLVSDPVITLDGNDIIIALIAD